MRRREFVAGVVASGLGATLPGCGRWSQGHEGGGTLRALRVDHDRCDGCRRCEEACHEASVRTGRTSRPLITVHSFPGPYHVPWGCQGCPDLPCVAACDYYAAPLAHRAALHVDPYSGAIALDREWCAGCERCIEACRRQGAGVLRWDDREYIAGACHLCDGDPECVRACPMGAIALVEVARRGSLALRTPEAVAAAGLARRGATPDEPAPELGDACDGQVRALRVDHDRCTGCRLCEAACDEANQPRTVAGVTLPGRGDTTRSLIRVHLFASPGPYAVAWACQGCPDLPCVAACEAEAFGGDAASARRALHVDARTGAIAFEPAFCTSCVKCVDACAERGGGVLRWDAAELVSGACHLCGGEPACARLCPEGAIEVVVVDRTRPLEARRPEEVARRRAGVTRENPA